MRCSQWWEPAFCHVLPSRAMTPTFNAGFCEALGHTRASGEDHTWRGRKPELGGRGDNGELMALLSQGVKNERMRPFPHLQSSALKGLNGHQRGFNAVDVPTPEEHRRVQIHK